jgi:hypothetical protein
MKKCIIQSFSIVFIGLYPMLIYVALSGLSILKNAKNRFQKHKALKERNILA